MTLREWFKESEQNVQAIRYGRNGQKYIYYRNTKSKVGLNSEIEEVVELKNGAYGAWLWR